MFHVEFWKKSEKSKKKSPIKLPVEFWKKSEKSKKKSPIKLPMIHFSICTVFKKYIYT